MTEILDKTREWSNRFGSVLKASAKTQYPQLYKGAVGGIEHVISVDNGAFYMEMWRDGKDNYYATTGAAIKPLPGLAKGARLDEALDRFFTLMAKVEKLEKGKTYRDRERASAKQPPQRTPSAFKKRGRRAEKDYPPTASSRSGVTEVGGAWRDKPRGPRRAESGMPLPAKKAIPKKIKRLLGLSKRVVAKIDPEIGPSHSVGHKKPSDLSPESGVSKLARSVISNLFGEPYNQMRKANFAGPQPVSLARKTKKNVVALTAPGGVGNQPGSGRVKPGTPQKTYVSPQGFSGRQMGKPGEGASSGVARKPASGAGQPLKRGRKIDDITGGRVSGPPSPPGVDTPQSQITPVKVPPQPAQGPGYGRLATPRKMRKGCDCATEAAVAKAVRAVGA